jgi:hypothetical protein
MFARRALAGAGVALAGCAFPQAPLPSVDGTLVNVSTGAMQYRSPLPRDVQGAAHVEETHGESCLVSLSFPPQPPALFLGSGLVVSEIPWSSLMAIAGDDGYRRAVAQARDRAGGSTLFDVRADLHTTSVLGLFRRDCIEVHGRVAR